MGAISTRIWEINLLHTLRRDATFVRLCRYEPPPLYSIIQQRDILHALLDQAQLLGCIKIGFRFVLT